MCRVEMVVLLLVLFLVVVVVVFVVVVVVVVAVGGGGGGGGGVSMKDVLTYWLAVSFTSNYRSPFPFPLAVQVTFDKVTEKLKWAY